MYPRLGRGGGMSCAAPGPALALVVGGPKYSEWDSNRQHISSQSTAHNSTADTHKEKPMT